MDQPFKVQAIVKACNKSGIAVYSLLTKCQQWLTANSTCEVLIAGVFSMLLEIKRFKQVASPEMS